MTLILNLNFLPPLIQGGFTMEPVQLAFIGGIWMTEILVIGGVALLLFGPNKFPELGRGIARGIREFKEGIKEGGAKKDQKNTKPENHDGP